MSQYHDDPIIDKIIVARIIMMMSHPFFGNLATRLEIVDGSDWCQTAATNGRAIYFNRTFFEKLTERQILFVLAHEIMHSVFDHMGRVDGRDRNIFNIAADYCVNGQLIRDKIGDSVIPGIEILHDIAHYGKSAEQIYDEIYKDSKDDLDNQLGKLLDEHIDWENGDGKNGQPTLTKDEIKQIRDEMKEAILDAAQSVSAGNVPAEIKRMIKDLTEPKMNWREILRQQIQSSIKNDYSWSRPSRKGWHVGAILPGSTFADTIDICVAIDTSGSISDVQTRDFLSEVRGIMDEYKEYKINLWCFDTRTHNHVVYDSYDNTIDQYQLKGGGGTDFDCNWKFMKDNDINPKKLIMFTDGYPFGSWGDPTYADTVFIIHGNKNIIAPFGITAHYDEKA